jgi:PAS domain S-box-containing protein
VPVLAGTPELLAFFDDAPVGLALLDLDLRYVRINPALAAVNGAPAHQHVGRRPSEMIPGLGEQIEAGYARVRAEGRGLDVEVTGAVPARPGDAGTWIVSYYPVHDVAGRLEAIGTVVVDVSDRVRAERENARLRRRAEFLARAADLLASSLETDRTVQAVVEAAVPPLADWASCAIVDGDELRLMALAGTEGQPAPQREAIRREWPQALASGGPMPLAVRERRPVLATRDEDGPFARALRRLGATSVLTVPLITPAGVVGALGMLHTTSGRRHGAEDLETAQALADRAGVAIAHASAHEDARRRLALLDAFFDSAPAGLAFVDEGLRYQRVNEQLARLNGHDVGAHVGRTPAELLGDELGGPVEQVLRGVLQSGRKTVGDVSTADDRHFMASFAPVELGDEQIGVTGVILDITERKRGEAREHLLGGIGEALDAEFSVRAAAQRLAGELARHVGGRCTVKLVEAGVEAAVGEAGPGGGEVTEPLATRGRTLGSVTVAAGVRPLDDEDARLVHDVARRAAISLDNLSLYIGQKEIATTLQGRLLPRTIPAVPGVEVATRYRAAGVHNEVGGDFYDVFEGRDGSWTALVGDVAGKGAEAAALTASIRQIVRTGTRFAAAAAEVLAVANEELLNDDAGRSCTLAHAVLREDGPLLRVEITLAGHPLPAVRRADGRVEWAGRPGTLLGGLHELELVPEEVVLAPGDLLLLYTDGAVESARGRRGGEVLDLAPVLAAAPADAAEAVRRVEAAAVAAAGGGAPDDIALVALRRL